MIDENDVPLPEPPAPNDADCGDYSDIVDIDSANITRVTFIQSANAPAGAQIEFDCLITIDSCFEVEDVKLRVLRRGLEVAWATVAPITVEGVQLFGRFTRRVCRRGSRTLMRIFAESDLGAEVL